MNNTPEFSAPATPPATPPPAPSPTAARVIAAGKDKVWTALTDARAIARYQPDLAVESDWVEGSGIAWSGTRDGRAFRVGGLITGFDPETALTFTTEAGDGADARTVTVRLDGGELSTEVSVADSGAPAAPMQDWNAWLERLKDYLESTESLDSSNVLSRDAADR